MIVRYPNGVSITYNDATFLVYGVNAWKVYTADPERGGKWVASIMPSAGAMVEVSPPCKIENPAENLIGERALQEVAGRIRSFRDGYGVQLIKLKRALADFNMRTQRWRQIKHGGQSKR